jgi:tRNA G37 N-methylase TrmD
MTFAAHILTLYPEMFPGPLGASLAGRALGDGCMRSDKSVYAEVPGLMLENWAV